MAGNLPVPVDPSDVPEEEEWGKDEEPWRGDYIPSFRGWNLGFRGTESGLRIPRLGSAFVGSGTDAGLWEPEVLEGEELLKPEIVCKSDYDRKADPPFSETSKGFYSLRSLKDVLSHYPDLDIYGEIVPLGKRDMWTGSFRSEWAKVSKLFRGLPRCYVCQKPAAVFIHNDTKHPLCKGCLKRLEKLLATKGFKEVNVDDMLEHLAQVYDAEITDMPDIED